MIRDFPERPKSEFEMFESDLGIIEPFENDSRRQELNEKIENDSRRSRCDSRHAIRERLLKNLEKTKSFQKL